MIADWSTINTLTTPAGNLALNAAAGARYLTLEEACSSGADLRATFENMPQADGQLNHPQYLTGYGMTLALALWQDGEPACGADAQDMLDDLGEHLNALRNPTGTTRIIWTPDGLASRMANDLSLSQRPVVRVVPRGDEAGIVTVTFSVVSEFPHEKSEAERTPASIAAGTGLGTTLTNNGNTAMKPVFKVYGFTSEFWLENLTTGKLLHYDADLPGAAMIGTSQYVEIDMFRGTVVLNGDVDDSYVAGIDFETTEYWALEPGDNEIAVIGASVDVLWNDAWL